MKTGLDGLEDSVLPLVAKPGRYLAPPGFRCQGDFERAGLTLCLVIPEPLDVAVADAGFHTLLLELQREEGLRGGSVVVDFTAGAERDMIAALREMGLPMFSFGLRRSLTDFDLLLVRAGSLLSASRAMGLLSLAGIPLRAEERGAEHPLVVITGNAAWYPETLSAFADACFLGDPEVLVPGILNLSGSQGDGGHRRETLFRLSEIDGMVVPAFGSREGSRVPEGRWLSALPPAPGAPFLPLIGTELEGGMLEIARTIGPECPVSPPRPLRWRPVEDALRGAEWLQDQGGDSVVVLSGESAGRHPELARVLELLNQDLGPSGARVRLREVDPSCLGPAVARELQKCRDTELHFTPIAPSERLRQLAERPLCASDLSAAVEIALRGEWPGLRLRFLLGMPGETPADREEALVLLERWSQARDRSGRRPRLAVELCPFVPVRLTPWEASEGVDPRHWSEEVARWRRRLHRVKVRVHASSPVPAAMEASLRRGGDARASVLPELAAFWEHLPPDPDGAARAWEEFWAHVATRLDDPETDPLRLPLGLVGEILPGRAETEWGPLERAIRPFPPAPRGDEGGRRPRRGVRVRDDRRAERFRLRVAKTEPVRFISHLDLARAMLRALRRSELPVAMSGGKDHRPKVSFGPPLPLGMTSTAEYLDVAFLKEVPESFARALNDCLPEGVAVLASAPLRSEPDSLSSGIQIATYEVTFPDALIDRFLDGLPFDSLWARLLERLAAVLSATEVPITKGRGGERKTFNARPSLLRAEVVRDDGGRPALSLGLTLNRPDSARPELWTTAILDWTHLDERLLRVHRSGLYIPGGQKWLDPLAVVAPGFEWWRQPVRGGTVL